MISCPSRGIIGEHIRAPHGKTSVLYSVSCRYNTSAFSSRRERTYEILLRDMYNNYSDSGGGHGSHNNNNVALSSAAAATAAAASVTSPSGDGGSPPAVAIHKNKEQTAQVGVLQESA